MIDHDPYVADPAEPGPLPRYPRLRPLLVAVVVVLLTAAVMLLVLREQGVQDPALDVPPPVASPRG